MTTPATPATPAVATPPPPVNAPPGFHLPAKPSGSTCNIDCTYCFFLSKEALYPNNKDRMAETTLEACLRPLLESHRTPQFTVAWQGGEPTLMKFEFFRRAVEHVEKHRHPGQGSFDLVMRGWRLLRKHGVDFHSLCTVNAVNVANQQHGRAVSRFFCDELGAKWVQFILIIERATEQTISIANKGWSEQAGKRRLLYTQTGNLVTERTVGAEPYGRFLFDVFEEWVRHDVGQVFVQLFDVTLEAFFDRHLLCRNCKVLNWCNSGCPKDRFALSKDGESGQNCLCADLELFFTDTGANRQSHGLTAAAEPPAGRRDGVACRRGCRARALSALRLRQRQEVPLLPRRQGTGFAFQRGRPRNAAVKRHIAFESGNHKGEFLWRAPWSHLKPTSAPRPTGCSTA